MKIKEQIAKVRARIADFKSDKIAVEAQKRSRKEVSAYLDATINTWSAAADAAGRLNMDRAAAGFPAEFLTVRARGMTQRGPVMVSVDLGPFAVMLLGRAAVSKATAEALTSIPEGLDQADRAKRLVELAASLHVAHIEEENLICESEEAGDIIMHRPDADPAYVLTRSSER